MATEKIYRSPYPDMKLPETSCWHFVFENQNRPADDRVVYVDGLTDNELKYVLHLTTIIFHLFMKSQVRRTEISHKTACLWSC
jgi:hypothetical protein